MEIGLEGEIMLYDVEMGDELLTCHQVPGIIFIFWSDNEFRRMSIPGPGPDAAEIIPHMNSQ